MLLTIEDKQIEQIATCHSLYNRYKNNTSWTTITITSVANPMDAKMTKNEALTCLTTTTPNICSNSIISWLIDAEVIA
jgi:hypothetical protein